MLLHADIYIYIEGRETGGPDGNRWLPVNTPAAVVATTVGRGRPFNFVRAYGGLKQSILTPTPQLIAITQQIYVRGGGRNYLTL